MSIVLFLKIPNIKVIKRTIYYLGQTNLSLSFLEANLLYLFTLFILLSFLTEIDSLFFVDILLADQKPSPLVRQYVYNALRDIKFLIFLGYH